VYIGNCHIAHAESNSLKGEQKEEKTMLYKQSTKLGAYQDSISDSITT